MSDQRSVVNFAFSLINNKKEEAYLWLCQQLDTCRRELHLPTPSVVITDKEKALKNALNQVFPAAQQQLCVWHINANVKAKIRSRWNSDDLDDLEDLEADSSEADDALETANTIISSLNAPREYEPDLERLASQPSLPLDDTHSREGMFEAWKRVIYAPVEAEFEAQWKRLNDTYPLQHRILSYISKEYMAWRLQWAKCYIDNYRNFGQRVNSPTETAYKDVKLFLVTGTGDLLALHQSLEQMLEKKKRDYIQRAADMNMCIRTKFLYREWLRDINTQVSYVAVDLMAHQARLAIAAHHTEKNPRPKPLSVCTGKFTQQFALPYAHQILGRLEADKSIQKQDIHPRWWLEKHLVRNLLLCM